MESPERASSGSGRRATGPVKRARRAALRVLLLPGLRGIYRPFLRNTATVFLLHRFSDPDRRYGGHDPAHLRRCLGWLRDHDVPIVSLDRLVSGCLGDGEVPPGAVCFTVDDAYDDFFRVGLPVFAEYECPVTVFVPTGFVDGDCWLWWDRIEYVLRRTGRRRLPTPVGDSSPLSIGDEGERRRAARLLRGELQRVPEERRERALERLSDTADVPLPEDPPPEYRPMSWDQIREAETGTARFAPHSVTHPVLSMISDDELEDEVVGSWSRLQGEVERPVPVFGYPLGPDWAFGEREERAVRDAGLVAAVSTLRRYVRTNPWDPESAYRWRIPRLGFPGDWTEFLHIVSGLLRLRHRVAEWTGEAVSLDDDR